MKKIILILGIAIGMSSCGPTRIVEKEHWLQNMEAPVVCLGKGSFMGDCLLTVIDGNGKIVKETDNAMCTVQVGDTILR